MKQMLFVLVTFISVMCYGQGLDDYSESDFLQNMEKGEKAALLMVHFGTTHDDTRTLTIDVINQKAQAAFSNLDMFEAYTSRIIIKRLKARGIVKLTPFNMLLKLRSEGYTRVLVQSTNIITGWEHESLKKDIVSVIPFFKEIRLGNPLLYDVKDAQEVVSILTRRVPADAKKHEHVVLVGHGTTNPSTAIYSEIDYMLKADGHPNYHVGTIEGYPTFQTMLARLKADKAKVITLVPFMFVAGDHVRNDISVEWKEMLEKEGFKVKLHIEGLGQIPEVQDIFINHIRFAMSHAVMDIMTKKAIYSR